MKIEYAKDLHLENIHQASIQILEKSGFAVTSPQIADALKKSGIRTDGLIAYFTEEQIFRQLSKVPEKFTLFARNADYNMMIGGEESFFAPGYGCTSIISADGQRRAAVYEDYIKFAKLVQQSDFFQINGGILTQPCDIPPQVSIPMMLYAALTNSDKCILGISSTASDVRRVMDMMSIVFGVQSFVDRPHVLTLINTTSPLELGNIAADTLLLCAAHKQPVIVSPGPISGATGPVTAAGNLALGNAETLAAISIAQILQPGLPVLYGLMPTTMNMATGTVCIGSPISARNMVCSARLAKFYGLPNRCGGALTDAKAVGLQSSMESMLTMSATLAEQTSFVLHSAGILDSFGAMSYEKFAADLEVIRSLTKYGQEIDTSEEHLTIERIIEVGIGGNHLVTDHTYQHFRESIWLSNLDRGKMQCADNAFDQETRVLQNTVNDMLDQYQSPIFDHSIRKQLTQYLNDEIGVNDLPR